MSLLEQTLRLVHIDSVSRNEDALATLVQEELRTNPLLEVERIGDNVVARTNGRHTTRLLVAGHLDTVPGNASAGLIAEGQVQGLGACDMKGSLAAMLHLAKEPSSRSVEVTWVFYAREEIARSESGLLEIAELRPDLLVADAAILAEPSGGAVEAGCQGSLRVEVEIRGQRAHTARPFTGRNAIHRLGDFIQRVSSYEPRRVRIDGVDFTEQLQVVGVEGGVAPNVVPDNARCTLNHRVAPDRGRVECVAALKAFFGDLLEENDRFEVVDWASPATPSLDNHWLTKLVALTNQAPRGKVGWTDVATFADLGIPATNFGAGDPLLAHRSDEFVTEFELNEFSRVLELWLA